jgi:hypothetical protein
MVELASMSDAVVVAIPELMVLSHLTADGDFVYTEWKFRIKEVIQDNPKAPVVGKTISIVRAGGTLVINGRKVIATEWQFDDFQPGDEYLLFLKHVPETGYYKANGGRTYDLSHGPIDAGRLPFLYMDDHEGEGDLPVEVLLRDTKAAAAAAESWRRVNGVNQ